MNGPTGSPQEIRQARVTANGLAFHVVTAGPVDGPMVVLLHGFPEFSFGWRRQIPVLAAAGFHVVVPDQRGYGLSDKPKGNAAYDLDVLAQDVVALVDALGGGSFSLVGHDWGGIVAWRVATDVGRRLERLVVVNAPNVDVAAKHLWQHPLQLFRSFYVGFFQIPLVPEGLLSAGRFFLLAGALRATSAPGTFDDADLAVYREAWGQPGALTTMLNWYRALPGLHAREPQRIATPTMIVWGDRDTALDASFAEDCAALCDDARVHHLKDATHWVHHERADDLNALLGSFLGRTA